MKMFFVQVVAVAMLALVAAAQEIRPASPKPLPEKSNATMDAVADRHAAMGEPIEWMAPKYPKHARKAGTRGDVVLILSIDANGNVTEATPISGDPELVDATIKSARAWKYIPYDLEGTPHAVTTKIVARFDPKQGKPADVAVAFEIPSMAHFDSVYKVGNGVTAPKAIYTPDPHYSEQARTDKYQGTCVLSIIVGPDGRPYNIKLERSLGEGLDQQAVLAVRQWKFEPARKDGKAVAVSIKVEVQFRLN